MGSIKAISVAVLSMAVSVGVVAAKKELSPEAYNRWKSIVDPVLSDDGKWVAYMLQAGSGHVELVVRSTQGSTEFRIPRGSIPKQRSGGNEVANLASSALSMPLRITADSRHVLFSAISSGDQRKVEQGGGSEAPKDQTVSLGILRLSDGRITQIPDVVSFVVPENAGQYVAYTQDVGAAQIAAPPETGPGSSRTLVLRDLITGADVKTPDVKQFTFDGQGRYLAYTVEGTTPHRNGVYVRRLSDGRVVVLLSGPGRYRSLTFDAAGEQLAFLSDQESVGQLYPRYALYYSASPLKPATVAVPQGELPAGFDIADETGVKFTRVGNAVVFGIAPQASSSPQSSESAAQFDLWHWQEPAPLRQGRLDQPVMARSVPWWKMPRSYLAAYHVDRRLWVQLGSEAVPSIILADDARHAIGVQVQRQQAAWLGWTADVHIIDVASGARQMLGRALSFGLQDGSVPCPLATVPDDCRRISFSPEGRYAVYFSDRRWWSIDLTTGQRTDLTGRLLPEIRFDFSDYTTLPSPRSQDLMFMVQRIARWTKGDRRMLIQGEHDIWEVDPSGATAPRNLTGGVGRRENIVFRFWSDDIDSSDALLVGVDKDTMASGIWRLRPGAAPEQLLMLDKLVTLVAKARRADQYLLTLQTFAEYPDLWTGPRLDKLTRVSNANPQQQEYLWGSAELVRFTSDWGVTLSGILYKPENFDPNKRYPMIVSLYQIAKRGLHRYAQPEALQSSPYDYPWPSAVSRGYLHFVPDVLTSAPYPGPSALAAVVPAVQSVVDRGYVDVNRIALTGHSFGGFETNFLITHTDMFRCAISDAGPTNFLSMHASDLFGPYFLERSQPTLGGSIWDRPFVYISNSPVFFADRVSTPLLMMHNDADIHPPRSQGIEFFNALRRNGKEAYLINYQGEGHGLMHDANRLDWDRRVREFLDYHLKDGPRPTWMNRPSPAGPRVSDNVTRVNPAAVEGARH